MYEEIILLALMEARKFTKGISIVVVHRNLSNGDIKSNFAAGNVYPSRHSISSPTHYEMKPWEGHL